MSQSGSISGAQAGTGDLLTLTADSGGVIQPDINGNINIVGDDGIVTVGDNPSNTITIRGEGDIVTVTTTDAATTVLFSVGLNEDQALNVRGDIVGTINDYSGSIGGTITAIFRRPTAGVATLVGLPIVMFTEDMPNNPSFSANVSGNNVRIIVNGIIGNTVNWRGRIVLTYDS